MKRLLITPIKLIHNENNAKKIANGSTSPAGWLSIFLILLLQSASAQSSDSLFLASAVLKLKNAKEYTLKVLDLMPEEKYSFRPTSEEMSFSQQLLHICSNLGWLSSSYLSNLKNPISKDDEKLNNKDSIRLVVVKTYDFAISVLNDFPIKHLPENVKFFAGPMTKLQIINLLSDHQTHHRGQLLVYLRLCGITPPKYVGW